MPKRKTSDDYALLANERGCTWLGPEVPNTGTKTRWRCSEGHEWRARYDSIQRGHGCPVCGGTAPRTPEDYHVLATERGFDGWLGPEVPNVRTKTKWRCDQGHEWWATYNRIQQGYGCPVCGGNAPRTPEDYRALAIERGLEGWLGPEVPNIKIRTKWRCSEGHEWWTTYASIRAGGGCPACAGTAPKTPEDYQSLASERNFGWLGPKVSNVTFSKTKWRCGKGHEWWATYNNVQQGSGCPICNESRGETAIADTLDTLSIKYGRQAAFRKCRNHHPLPFDFSFTLRNVRFLVEYDGQQHFGPVEFFGGEEAFKVCQINDKIKGEFAAKYGFTLIRIPYTVESIQTYLIQAIADACGIEFGDVLATAEQKRIAVKPKGASVQPTVGIQMPLL